MPSITTICLVVSTLALGPIIASAEAQDTRSGASSSPAATAATPAMKIDIPALPKAKITMEVDARDDDLLGLVKQVDFGGIPMAEALGNITHLRVVTYERPAGPNVEAGTGFYEEIFRKEGARRTFFRDQEGNRTLVLTFDRPRRQIAVILEKQNNVNSVTIVRADGYPDLQKISPFLSQFLPGIVISGKAMTAAAK